MSNLKTLKEVRDRLLGDNAKRIKIWINDDGTYSMEIDRMLWGDCYSSYDIESNLRNIAKGIQMVNHGETLASIKEVFNNPKYSMRGALEEIKNILEEIDYEQDNGND